jgi:hypothetical protein
VSKRDVKPKKPKKVNNGKAGKGGDDAAGDARTIRIAAHPRARRSVRRARAWAGMGGFALVLLLAVRAGVPAFDATLRALAGGLVLHFIAWGFAIALWRRLMVIELEVAQKRMRGEAAPPPAG